MSHLNSSGRSLSRADSQMTRVKNGQGTEGSARAVGREGVGVPPPLPYIPAARKTTVKMTVGRRRSGENSAAHLSASHASKRCRASASATPLSTWDCVIPVLTTRTGTILPVSATADALLNSLEGSQHQGTLRRGNDPRNGAAVARRGLWLWLAQGDDSQLGGASDSQFCPTQPGLHRHS